MSGIEALEEKFAGFLSWEKAKRRRENLVLASLSALTIALATLPLPLTLTERILIILLIFAGSAGFELIRRRWSAREDIRAVARLDKALRLDERALTAWEMIRSKTATPPASLVIAQATERLKSLDPREMFPLELGWKGRSILPLFIFWLVLLSLGLGTRPAQPPLRPRGLAYEVKEFSQQLEERAKRDRLNATFKFAQDLQRAAQKSIDEKLADEKFQKELGALAKTAATIGRSPARQNAPTAGESDQTLRDLKAELESARDFLGFDQENPGKADADRDWLERLSLLPQLKKQLGNGAGAMGGNEMKAFMKKLENDVNGELDRRSLLETQQFLDQLAKQGGQKGEGDAQIAAGGGSNTDGDYERGTGETNAPGKEPGRSPSGDRSLPAFDGGSPAHVKGMISPGDSEGLVFKGKPMPGKTQTAAEDVYATYRRQAEAEIKNEKVPEALKETVRNYFLSLGNGDGRRE